MQSSNPVLSASLKFMQPSDPPVFSLYTLKSIKSCPANLNKQPAKSARGQMFPSQVSSIWLNKL